jgi:hypothetical protein
MNTAGATGCLLSNVHVGDGAYPPLSDGSFVTAAKENGQVNELVVTRGQVETRLVRDPAN